MITWLTVDDWLAGPDKKMFSSIHLNCAGAEIN